MYPIERIHIDHATDQDLQILQVPRGGKTIVIYDENQATCWHYTGCHPSACATANCMHVITRTEEIIEWAGFRL